jgi:phage tail tube protein FII
MLTRIVTVMALASGFACAQDSVGAGTYKGTWAGGSGGGDFQMTLAADGKGGLTAKVLFSMGEEKVPCKTTSVKVEGASLKVVYQFDLQGNALQSAVEGKLKGKTLEGTYKTTMPGGDDAVDQGTWKVSSGG